MTDQEINVATADICGWKRAGAHLDYGWQSPHWHGPKGECQLVLPDYANDLNAMHEAVMSLPADLRVSFNHQLMNMLQPNDPYALDRTINATARQRAEAFLRTLGKWREAAPAANP
jgi:hypothetical protein